jgi:hypothetical protein
MVGNFPREIFIKIPARSVNTVATADRRITTYYKIDIRVLRVCNNALFSTFIYSHTEISNMDNSKILKLFHIFVKPTN